MPKTLPLVFFHLQQQMIKSLFLLFKTRTRSYDKRFQEPQRPGSIPLVPQTIKRSLTQPLKLSLRQPPILTPIRLTPHQHEVHDPGHLMSHSHHRTPLTPPPRHPLIHVSEPRIIADRSLSTLHQRPPEPLITRTRHATHPDPLTRLVDTRHQPHPRRELLIAAEPTDVASTARTRPKPRSVFTCSLNPKNDSRSLFAHEPSRLLRVKASLRGLLH